MSKEQRIADRIQLTYFLKVHERGCQRLLGQVLDITSQGLNILSPEVVEPGSVKSILVELPDSILGKSRLSLNVECRWCKKDVNPSYYSIGFRIEAPTAREVEIIKTLIERFEFGNELHQAFG